MRARRSNYLFAPGVALFLILTGGALLAQQSSSQQTPKTPEQQNKAMDWISPEEKQEIAHYPSDLRQREEAYLATLTTPEERKKHLQTFVRYHAMNKVGEIKDPDQKMDALAAFVKEQPEFMSDANGGAANVAFMTQSFIKANRANAAKLQAKLGAIDNAFPTSPTVGKALFESFVAKDMLSDGADLDYAASLAQSSVKLLHEDEFVASERTRHEEQEEYDKSDKTSVPEPFSRADADVHFRQQMSARYAVLGKIQVKLGKNQDAEQSFSESLKFHPDMDAYVGLAKLEEARGDKAGALQNLYDADLTGHLDRDDIAQMKQMYLELHPGSTEESLVALLDEKYRNTFHNPVQFTPYSGDKARSDRTVLAELFTGAGCEPCMAGDLAFDADLKRYTRKEMVLLVYHDNAPVEDPLANNVTEERAKYYATGGSTPHAFLDGKEIPLVQGLPDHAQHAFDAISTSINKLIDTPTGADLKVEAKRHGSKVTVRVNGTIAESQSPLLLHIDLLEKEVSYSGENSLRFQPMVVRATAKQTAAGSGFNVSGRTRIREKYTFDLKKVTADNFAYYSQYGAALKKRTNGFLTAKYREYENVIDPNKLAVVAFVQNNATKDVLGDAYTAVTNGASPMLNASTEGK